MSPGLSVLGVEGPLVPWSPPTPPFTPDPPPLTPCPDLVRPFRLIPSPLRLAGLTSPLGSPLMVFRWGGPLPRSCRCSLVNAAARTASFLGSSHSKLYPDMKLPFTYFFLNQNIRGIQKLMLSLIQLI